MAIPLIGYIMAAVGGAVGVDVLDVVKSRVKKAVDEHWREYLQAALDDLGIVIDPEQGINDESLTRAINENLLVGTGIELASVLDRQKMLRGFEGIALEKISGDLGIPPVRSVTEIRTAVQAWLVDQLGAEIAAEVGDVVDAAKPLQSVVNKFNNAGEKKPWNEPTNFTPEGIDNRERQARYRSTHTKYWVLK